MSCCINGSSVNRFQHSAAVSLQTLQALFSEVIRRCLQALAEALKENKSITNIDLEDNNIGAEGAEAWCGVGSVECRGMLWMSCP